MTIEQGLAAFIERHGDRIAETAWVSALALVRRAADDAGEGRHGRWAGIPRTELRRLRADLDAALELAELAVAFQEAENERYRELTRDVNEAREESGRRRRREGTLPAELARLARAAARRDGREYVPPPIGEDPA